MTQKIGWISGNSGFLVRDLNHDGVINNGSELFGTGTVLANGQHASNGFQALSALDSNHDGVINAKDAAFNELMVWTDTNHDGISQANELHSMQSLNIASLNLGASHSAINSNGNWIVLDSTYTTTDGQVHEMGDVWFQSNTLSAADIAAMTTAQIATFSTGVIAALTTDQIAALTTADVAALHSDQIHALSTADMAALSKDQIHALTTDQVHALTTDQVHALTADQVHALTPGQAHALTADDLAAMTPQIRAITAHDMANLQGLGTEAGLNGQAATWTTGSHAAGLNDVFAQTHAAANAYLGADHVAAVADAAAHIAADPHTAGTMLTTGAEHHAVADPHSLAVQGVVHTVKDPLLG